MKNNLSAAIASHLPVCVKSVASAAVILSLTACGAETLDSIQTDLANGEDVNITLSTNSDGDLVIGIDDDDAPVLDDDTSDDAVDTAVIYDEATEGDITDDATNPLTLALGVGSNVISGEVVAGDLDYVTVNVPEGYVLSSLELANYESADDVAFIGIQEGTVFTEPPTDTDAANLLGFTLFGADGEGTDILPAIGSGAGSQGFAPPLEAGNYTFWIQQTGTDVVAYSFDLVTTLAADVPASGSLTVTLTNTSETQPMTPPIVVLHNAPDAENGMRLFNVGQPARPSVVAIAQNGNNAPLVDLLGYLTDQGRASTFGVGFADPANPGPLLPGMSASINLDLASEDQVMSVISMVVCTNDGFSAVNSHTLSADASETFMAPIYDAGSETNVLTLDYWVPPCGSDANLTDDENGSITPHPGQSGSENPAFDFEAGTRYLEVTVTRN